MEQEQQPGTRFVVEINPKIPRKLMRLEELATNLWYSWDRSTRTLFARLHPKLWDVVGHNPIKFLRRIDERRLLEAADDQVFLASYNRVLSAYDTYHNEPARRGAHSLRENDLVAYFCAEFGFHESFPIYSGGLGILAGDYCKAASDIRVPFVGVGLLYRQGYFTQEIDGEGNQIASNADSDFDLLPVTPALRADGSEVKVFVTLDGRKVYIKVWWARVGHVRIYLLDTDLEENTPDDREITHRLYGGDRKIRIEQEIVLGVGGTRALSELGLIPTVWHVNEGHAAFMLLERIRELVAQGLDFPSALEAVAANSVFTTHTSVPAGHDHFSRDLISSYLRGLDTQLGISMDQLLALGNDPGAQNTDFNMTALAVRTTRHQNGVSRIHGEVSSHICAGLWPQIPSHENPIGYVTNAVHVPTFLAEDWIEVFDKFLGGEWRNRLSDVAFWKQLDDIPDHLYWSVRQSLKSQMLQIVKYRVSLQHFRNNGSEAHLERILKYADSHDPNILTIGFARRFATYKRADLLFQNLDWLREIVLNPQRPVVFIFAGKAHPADQPGQDLIRQIHAVSSMPEFEGRILLVENYDMGLARRLLAGVDVWLNTPRYPLEASGTSGMKAGINGTINLSVLDGWWGEGYDGKNGWAIRPAPEYFDDHKRNREDARSLYEIIQDQVAPLYYDRGKYGYSTGWVAKSKYAMSTTLTGFNTARMMDEYISKYYSAASQQGEAYSRDNYAAAKSLSVWKARVRAAWPKISLRRLDTPQRRVPFGESMHVEVAVDLDGLQPDDVCVELLLNRSIGRSKRPTRIPFKFAYKGPLGDGREQVFVLEMQPELCGQLDYHIRIYPSNALLTHPFETGLMTWL
jgi:starch phosphorylase